MSEDDDSEAAKRYRNRAEELRTIADDCKSEHMKLTLRRLAADYEQCAQIRERIASNRKALVKK